MTGAIYHFTNKSEKRPIIYEKQIEELKEFARRLGIEIKEIYCDKTLIKRERSEFQRFLAEADKYEALVTKDFNHISKNTMACMRIMKELRDRGVSIFSIENGTFDFSEAPYDRPLRAASYTHGDGKIRDVDTAIQIQQDIYSLFVKLKTGWTMVGHYADVCTLQNDSEQEDLQRLIADKDKYDIVIVNNLNDINWRTAQFCKIREQLGKPIFSLQDGYLMYKKEK